MRPRHLTVSRTARYFTLGPDGAPVRELWIVLHGYAQLASRSIRHDLVDLEASWQIGRASCRERV